MDRTLIFDFVPEMHQTKWCVKHFWHVLDAPWRVVIRSPHQLPPEIGSTWAYLVGNDDAKRHSERYRVPGVRHTQITLLRPATPGADTIPFSKVLERSYRDGRVRRMRYPLDEVEDEVRYSGHGDAVVDAAVTVARYVNGETEAGERLEAALKTLASASVCPKLMADARYYQHFEAGEIVWVEHAAKLLYGSRLPEHVERIRKSQQIYWDHHAQREYVLLSNVNLSHSRRAEGAVT